jgi:hypothetical protein
MAAGGPVTGLRILNGVPSKNKENDWTIDLAIEQGLVTTTFQEKVDLREDWWNIGDQGRTSSCVGWASTDALLRWHLVKSKLIHKHDHLSIRFTWMAAKETDKHTKYAETFIESSGVTLKGGLDVMRKYGAVHERYFKFEHGFVDYAYDTKSFYDMASQLKIKGYYRVINDDACNVDFLRMWISSQGPVIALADIDKNFSTPVDGKLEVYDKNNIDGSHAISIVGYDKDYFIVRNSWGTEYGDGGYVRCSNAYITGAVCEAYGIVI